MKVFVIGLPQSGRTTVAKALAEDNYHYISAIDWIQNTFRPFHHHEDKDDYRVEYENFYFSRLKVNPYLSIDNILDIIDVVGKTNNFVIDGILNPKDFFHLFNYNEDVVVFLNRTDPSPDPKDFEGVAVNVMRDYCLYLATTKLLDKQRWLEYNLKIPGENSDFIKQLGKHNLVTITKSIKTAINHLKGELCKLQT